MRKTTTCTVVHAVVASCLATLALVASSGCRCPARPQRAGTTKETRTVKPTPAPPLAIADDVDRRLARFVPTDIDFDEAQVSADSRRVLKILVEAAQILDGVYLEQVSAGNVALRARLVADGAPAAALDYFDVMYGPWDRLEDDAPFVGTAPKPEGAGFYPEDLGRAELEAYIAAHPEQAAALKSYFTVVRRRGKELVAVPYSEAYAEPLGRAATLLEQAAAQSSHAALANYLRQRAAALRSNDYFDSDLAWMELGDSPIEVVIGPYEVYEDRLMGYKAAFEAFITLRDPDFSARLQKLASYNAELERALPLDAKHAAARGTASPISIVVEVFTAGDTRAGVQTAAFNLPNDERVRARKGSKKVMLKNVTEAKFARVLLPIARQAIDPALLARVDFETYFTDILLHEVAHGMGPGQITVAGRQTSVNAELKELYTAIEECKADIVGLVNGAALVAKGALPARMKLSLPATYLAGVFRAVRFGTEEAHGKAVLVAFNYLWRRKAVTYDDQSGRFGVDDAAFGPAVRALAGELLTLQAHGSYADARRLIETYGAMAPEMKQVLARLHDVPVDIRPRYTILDKMKRW